MKKLTLTILLAFIVLAGMGQNKPPRDRIVYNKTWHITDSVKRKGKLFYYCNSNGRTTWLIKK